MIHISELAMAYRGNDAPVLENVNLEVGRGDFVSLIGPSGCGKSTLLRAVTGLQPPSRGKIELAVQDNEVGFLFQDDALLPWRTACDNVALGMRINGMPKKRAREQARHWLASVGLSELEDRYPRELSGGQRKRVAIAQVLSLRPRLLLMDEPFASLDAIVRHYITSDLLAWVEREGLTVLMVTHDLEEAISLSDQVVLLGNGPRARIKQQFEVPLPRPRDLNQVRQHPEFLSLTQRLWDALSEEVEAPGGLRQQQRSAQEAPRPQADTRYCTENAA